MDNLYKDIYQCELCSSYSEPEGVGDFAGQGPCQTVPVSHFGDIDNAKVWLVLTNPKGDPSDPNVGHLVSDYVKNYRAGLSGEHAQAIYKHFSEYFDPNNPDRNVHPFFNDWMKLLDGLVVCGEERTFENGGICAVDVIKCPTVIDWGLYVHVPNNKSKEVTKNCFGQVQDPGPNHFIRKQIRHHKPSVLIIAQSLNGRIGKDWQGKMSPDLCKVLNDIGSPCIKKIYDLKKEPPRLSVALGSNEEMNQVFGSSGKMTAERKLLKKLISEWEKELKK